MILSRRALASFRPTSYLAAAARCTLVASLLALSACGGGGDGGGSGGSGAGGGASSGPSLSVGQTAVSVTGSVLSGAPTNVTISLSVKEPVGSTYFVGFQTTTNGISSSGLNPGNPNVPPSSLTILFRPGTSLAPGTYRDQVTLELCSDSGCTQPVPGTTVVIQTTYIVTSYSASQPPSMNFSETSVMIEGLAIDFTYPPVTAVPITLANFQQAPYFATSVSGNAVESAGITTTGTTQGTLNIQAQRGMTLGAGTYTSTITVTACLDSTCTNPVPGSPFQITVSYVVGNSISVTGANGYLLQAMQIAAQSMVWDSVHQLLYVVLEPTGAPIYQMVAVDPATQTVSPPVALDAASYGALDVSDDGQFLYVGLSNGTVERFVLPQMTPDIRITLATGLSAFDLRVAPGAPHTIAVALNADSFDNVKGEERGVAIYDDAIMRPNEATATTVPPDNFTLTGTTVDYLQWTSPTSLYGVLSGPGELFSMTVDPTGITSSIDVGAVSGGQLHYAQNSLFMDGGTIFNTTTNQTDSSLTSTVFINGLLPDSASGRLFVSNGATGVQLTALDLQNHTQIAQFILPGLAVTQNEWTLLGPGEIVIRVYDGNLVFVQGNFIDP